MALSPIPPIPPAPEDLDVVPVDDEHSLAQHCELLAAGFEMPIALARRLLSTALLADPTNGILVGLVDGAPVSTALLSVSGTTAGVYNVATPPEHRRRGYGAALSWAAVAEGARRGCDHAILQASPMGMPVYAAMGFTESGRYLHFDGPPADPLDSAG